MNRLEYERVMFNSEIPYPERMLYAYLRSCVNFETGIAGDAAHKRISYQAIREALEFRPAPGSHGTAERFDRDRIYKLLKSLERRQLVLSLPKESASKGRRSTIRKFLPLSLGSIRPDEEGERRATLFGDNKPVQLQLVSSREGETKTREEGDTSVRDTLSLNNYKYYCPDHLDNAWLGAALGCSVKQGLVVDIDLETEKFNLRNRTVEGYDYSSQREHWRIWICRSVEYMRKQQ